MRPAGSRRSAFLPAAPDWWPRRFRLWPAPLAMALLLGATACENTFARGEGDSDGVNDAEVGITF